MKNELIPNYVNWIVMINYWIMPFKVHPKLFPHVLPMNIIYCKN